MASVSGPGNDKYRELSAQIESKFHEYQQTKEIYQQKDRWRSEIELIIQELYPNCRLVLSGSSSNGFGTKNSDIDLVLCFATGFATTESYALRRLESLFKRTPHRFETELTLGAKVPIIHVKDKEKSFETEICVGNCAGVRNTFLLRCYAECDQRVKPLVLAIKLWANKANITDAKLKRLPGFAVVLLVIHYLQVGCFPPVLPSLQRRFPELFRSSDSGIIDQLRAEPPAQVHTYKSDNSQTLGELFIGFFSYFSTFDWTRTISIRTGGTLPTTSYAKTWRGPHIKLEDPTDGGNVTRAVFNHYEFSRIKRAFETGLSRLSHNPFLPEIMQ